MDDVYTYAMKTATSNLEQENNELREQLAYYERQNAEQGKLLNEVIAERDALEADNKEILREWKEATRTHNSSMDSMYKALAAMTQERDEAVGFWQGSDAGWAETQRELAASQAREQQLREALAEIASPIRQSDAAKAREYDLVIAHKALALPQDDTALREQNAKLLRELVAHIMANGCTSAVTQMSRKADELEGKE